MNFNFKKKYDVIFILGGGLKKDGNSWRTLGFDEIDGFGLPTGDVLRVIAGSYVFKNGLSRNLVVSGDKDQYKNIPKAPTIATVMKKELIELKVPAKAIKTEHRSANTYQQLKAVLSVARTHGWKSVAIISNKYHLPRIKAMIETGLHLRKLSPITDLISAEDILITYTPAEWKKKIELFYKSEGMKKRISIEKLGIKDIKAGKYTFR